MRSPSKVHTQLKGSNHQVVAGSEIGWVETTRGHSSTKSRHDLFDINWAFLTCLDSRSDRATQRQCTTLHEDLVTIALLCGPLLVCSWDHPLHPQWHLMIWRRASRCVPHGHLSPYSAASPKCRKTEGIGRIGLHHYWMPVPSALVPC